MAEQSEYDVVVHGRVEHDASGRAGRAVLGDLAASEDHAARRYEIRLFAFALGLVDDESEDEASAVREWIRPEDRIS